MEELLVIQPLTNDRIHNFNKKKVTKLIKINSIHKNKRDIHKKFHDTPKKTV